MQEERSKFTFKELRARRKLTQAQMAKKLGISTQTYNTWENDIDSLSISKIKIIAEALGVEFEDIFLG